VIVSRGWGYPAASAWLLVLWLILGPPAASAAEPQVDGVRADQTAAPSEVSSRRHNRPYIEVRPYHRAFYGPFAGPPYGVYQPYWEDGFAPLFWW